MNLYLRKDGRYESRVPNGKNEYFSLLIRHCRQHLFSGLTALNGILRILAHVTIVPIECSAERIGNDLLHFTVLIALVLACDRTAVRTQACLHQTQTAAEPLRTHGTDI